MQNPLIHFITNYVSVNDVANITLAAGGRPIMADAIEEMEEITSVCNCLVLNIGTLNKVKVASMLKAAEVANRNNIPIILDPIGVMASKLRKDAALEILRNNKIAIIKGNMAEIKALIDIPVVSTGIDSIETQSDCNDDIALQCAKTFQTVCAITGKTDIIADKNTVEHIEGGTPMLTNITGTGCMTAALIAVALASTGNAFESAINGIKLMKESGRIAADCLQPTEGLGSFKVKLFDTISKRKVD